MLPSGSLEARPSTEQSAPAHEAANEAVGAAFAAGATPDPRASTTVNIAARLLAVGTVAVSPPTGPALTGAPPSATRVATSPLPTPGRVLRSTTPDGASNWRALGPLSDHTETTQLPAGAVAVGVVCEVPPTSTAPVTEAIGPEAAGPEQASTCRVALAEADSATATGLPPSDAPATRENSCVVIEPPEVCDPAAVQPAGVAPVTAEFVDRTSSSPSPGCTLGGTVTVTEVTARAH